MVKRLLHYLIKLTDGYLTIGICLLIVLRYLVGLFEGELNPDLILPTFFGNLFTGILPMLLTGVVWFLVLGYIFILVISSVEMKINDFLKYLYGRFYS